MAQNKILIVESPYTAVGRVEDALEEANFDYLSVTIDRVKVKKAMYQNPIKIVILTGDLEVVIESFIQKIQELQSGVKIFVVTSRPRLLTKLVRRFPGVGFFNDSTLKNPPGFANFDLLVSRIEAHL